MAENPPPLTQLDMSHGGQRGHAKPAVPDHHLLRCIGKGAYGEVWLAKNVLGTFRAIKVVYRDTFSDPRPYEREFTGIQKFEPISRSNEGLVDILQIGRDDRAPATFTTLWNWPTTQDLSPLPAGMLRRCPRTD